MKTRGIRVVEFAGSRKADHAIITKLLCRRDSQAAQVHDRQRFRIVAEELNDVLDVLVYLSKHLIAFNYVVLASLAMSSSILRRLWKTIRSFRVCRI